ncbi:hypothetical protein X769_24585 [Mesorhizobium sp. LSJC268A00]|uniref:DUF6339 family protein n=1 Tax=unclassified Mesorhizobium TaxID=325217 RepID=UPI0003CDEC5A|nr:MULTISPECIES: DUF6339 family protein [unclassified Mesorhizobium]ESW99082.1 hypothetical protein X769_24585 [Mesorhizobium sp. LSJC268A00]ESZ12673.1 hypothetical protein X735_21275 [Mesorhizobium sp. L2C085B000]
MAVEPMKLLSAAVVDKLNSDVSANADRYRASGFDDLAKQNGWAIETGLVKWDPAIAQLLDPSVTPEAEIRNSLLVFGSFEGMTPALAREERLWTRLCHIEFLEFCRHRWLPAKDDVAGAARLHFFARGLTGCRDDNAVGRLWWNGHVASLAMPEDIEEGLRRLLATANTRLQIVDRADTAFRQPLVSGILRLLPLHEWFRSSDDAIAFFMREVNKRCGGILFEALNQDAIDTLLEECLTFAKARKVASHGMSLAR